MFCKKCGTEINDDADHCPNCAAEVNAEVKVEVEQVVSVPTYLVQAILVTIFCCLPFGIPAIVFAAQVNSKLASGDVEGALKSSQNAKTWCWVAFACGLVILLIQIVAIALNPAWQQMGR